MRILEELDSRGAKIFTADDNLLLSAQKTSTGKRGRLPFQLGWKLSTHIKHIDGEPVVAGYYNPSLEGSYLSLAAFEKLSSSEADHYKPHYVREFVTPDKATFTFSGNNIKLSLPKKVLIMNPRASRYVLAFKQFQYLHQAEVMAYSGTASTPRHIKEALRHHFKTKFRVIGYEHNIYLYGILGRGILKAAKKHAARIYPTTAYIKDNPKAEVMAKVYNVSALETGSTVNTDNDWYKIEATFQNQFFRRHPAQVNQYLTQHEIQDTLKPHLRKTYGAIMGILSGRQIAGIRRELGMGSHGNVVEKILH